MTEEKITEILSNLTKVECSGCSEGIKMCHHRPCWGTVSDFKKIIEAGYADKLMIDYYNSENVNDNKRVYFLSGANNGNECSKADFNPRGTCSLLVDDKCLIHDIKPTIGAHVCCKLKEDNYKEIYDACISTWVSEDGYKLLEDWKQMVDYQEKEDDAGMDIFSILNLL